ncbi:MAG: HAMP domain-containing histidine kinase [Elusimicrobia bacterium]|nr:HAMP domain-containing histidine kinase [Elusimicrobiota bacterium]
MDTREMTPKRPSDLSPSHLTHELRAPVTAIRLGLEVLQEQAQDRLTVEERRMLTVALSNTNRLERLVNDIMDYSKLIAQKMGLRREPVDARRLLGEAVDSMRALAVSKGVRLVKEGGEPLPRISAEAGRILQVLVNLLSNGIKFAHVRGTVSVSVSRGRFDHEGTLLFKVKDNGPGIAAKDMGRIFHAFAQGSQAQLDAGGTGLGLAISKLLVELHGGRIWAESWPGAGAAFYFTIPIAAEDMGRKMKAYPEPVEYSGLLVWAARRFNSFLALFF